MADRRNWAEAGRGSELIVSYGVSPKKFRDED